MHFKYDEEKKDGIGKRKERNSAFYIRQLIT